MFPRLSNDVIAPPSPAAYLVPAAGALLFAGLYRHLYRHYEDTYLKHWMRASLAASVAFASSLLVVHSTAFPGPTFVFVAVASVALVAGCAQAAWVLAGAYELAEGREIPPRTVLLLVVSLVVVGAVSALLLASDRGARGPRFISVAALYAVLTGPALLATAFWVWGALRGAGRYIAFGALSLLGLEHLLGLGVASPTRAVIGVRGDQLTLVDFLLHAAVTAGVLIWLLDQEWGEALRRTPPADSLTGLPKRRHFRLRLDIALATARQAEHQVAVFFLDLDRFKQINDSSGHAAGDHVLRAVAERVKGVLVQEQTVTRFGGDEFTILAPRIRDAEAALALASDLRDAVARPTVFDGREIAISTSIGISLYPDRGEDAETLLGHADAALYAAKRQGRDNYAMYSEEMKVQASDTAAH